MSTARAASPNPAEPAAARPIEGATPVMAQFLEMKAAHPGFLLFFRMGDFYELFFEDAVLAAEALGIALTKRGTHLGEPIPMCGVPIHNAERYLNDLIRSGFRVAVAEQTEDPAEAKKRGAKSVVNRAVVRLVTAGTLTEDALLDGGRHNFLAALADRPGPGAIAWADLSTGALRTAALAPCEAADAALAAQLARIGPREVLLRGPAEPERRRLVEELGALATEIAPSALRPSAAEAKAAGFFGVASLDAFGAFAKAEAAALGALIDYLEITQAGAPPLLRPPERESPGGAMRIDAATRRNLELTAGPDGGRAGSLLATVDRTVTSAGARLLADRLGAPSAETAAIARRLDAVDFCLDQAELRRGLREGLRGAPDLERALSRLHLGRGGPRDLAALRDGLSAAAALDDRLDETERRGAAPPAEIAAARPRLGGHDAFLAEVSAALVDEPPARLSDGGAIADGYDDDLDDARSLRDRARQVIAELQTRYQQEAGVAALKIKHNNVLGYFVETPASHADRMMSAPRNQTFSHRQTMANAVRFSTAELAELESRIARAGDRAAELERTAFESLRDAALARAAEIAATAGALAELDVAAALAELAETEGWTRPKISDDRRFVIEAGRHPVVEAALARGGTSAAAGAGAFVPNDCDLSADPAGIGAENAAEARPAPAPIWVVTGPNMAGKSTFLRQNALIAILAQAGAFVPARRAEIGVVDQLFSRVGASDDLARGRSTFMVEMVETAAILNQAGERALVILDEIGRGTATYDGLSIAWATLEHLEARNRCRALFATHYHELTTLAAARPGMRNVTVAVREWGGDVVFLREIRPGAADRSYGVQVARLAGLPKSVTARAEALLEKLERGEDGPAARAARLVEDLPLFAAAKEAQAAEAAERASAQSAPLAAPSAVEALLAEIDPDSLSPREALEALYRLKDALDGG